jgi:hypothetical protein
MWDRWQKGESLENIAQLFDRGHGSVERILRQTGGMRPPKRAGFGQALSLVEREEISRGIASNFIYAEHRCAIRSLTLDDQP